MSDREKLVVKSSPHIKTAVTTQAIMRDVVIALLPALCCAVVIHGWRALLLTAVCVISCTVFEYLARLMMKRDNTLQDLSAVVTGVLLGFNLPVTLPIWMAVLGSFFAIVIVKQLFGGIGQNFVNPAIGGRVFLLIAFTSPMTSWLLPQLDGGKVSLIAGATPLALLADPSRAAELPTYSEMLIGVRGGCLGETASLALIIGGIYLIVRGVIQPVIPLVFLGTMFGLSFLFGTDPVYQLLSGGAIIGAFFMATDYTTSPATFAGKLVFAFGCGFITMIIRLFGNYPEGVSFAILFMNILVPHINALTRTTPFSTVKPEKAKGGPA